MIVSRLIGGLGNQMFQYAAGRAVSLRQRNMLRIDISDFDHYGLHNGFELFKVFLCGAEIATADDVRNILGWRASAMARRILLRPKLARLHGPRLMVEPHINYWAGIRELPRDIYLSGYWQSEHYFSDVSEDIRTDFVFRWPLLKNNADLAKRIDQTTAVSLHIRRGDYVSDVKTAATLGPCTLDYYRAAIFYISAHVERPEFFIFSDDIEWAKANLKIDFPCRYVNHNHGEESYNDMHLMSLCRHHIIANSSFSWWGAWLNPSPNKIVVAPIKWFANDAHVEDICPTGWVRL